ncbi:MAG: recombinase family protein [Amycolatopsis sp.]|uniref:recombinase family protein n=1 Tax=Amycolatopsis sp. TaxID=37632 RepID=UPI002613809E|nr:recombinase family protein [Amycolatopsis sp.]MCU1685430.1 recombinase family protein [Amycolatopsis sp.]
MNKESNNTPDYDADDQGLSEDFRIQPLSSQVRQARSERYTGTKKAARSASSEGTTADAIRARLTTTTENHTRAKRSDRAVIYLRVSTEEQARVGGTAEGYSIPYQRDACHRKAEALGLAVVEEYVDAGHSAKSANRPQLQRMLRDLRAQGVGWVIVHKIDRLARNTRDDHQINDAISAAGARLLSVVDLIDDSPQGKFNYTIQAGLAQLYSDNLAIEVMKGLSKKAQAGGTPYRAPIGYLNKRRFEGVADIRWVEVDPERSPLIRWAFEEYASGNWSLATLRLELIDKGLTNFAGKPISINGLYKILTNAYYTGTVPFQGAYYEGTHEPLVDLQTWLLVQQTLEAHNFAGEKEFLHSHYLKGSIWCGNCGSRLIFSRNKGKGGTYDYFVCIGRHRKRNDCTRRALAVKRVEVGVEEFYLQFEVPAEQLESIQQSVGEEFARIQAVAETDMARSRRRLVQAQDQRQKLLTAHYEGAIPQDMLKTEMTRLTADVGSAERELSVASASVVELESQLGRALEIAGQCADAYREAVPAIRRQFNQGFFKKLYIAEDGSVQEGDLNQPFAALMARVETAHPADDGRQEGAQARPDGTNDVTGGSGRTRPSAVWRRSGTVPRTQKPPVRRS